MKRRKKMPSIEQQTSENTERQKKTRIEERDNVKIEQEPNILAKCENERSSAKPVECEMETAINT